MIERGDIKPMIIVSMTFDSENKSQDFSRSTEEIAVFHNDFANDLLPYIDSHFNTKADRAHRIFSGFSLGAVTTWYAFCYNSDLVKHFLPMSGDYTVTCTVGTQDPIWDQVNNQMTAMLKRPVFSGGNVRCMIKENGFHDYNAVFEYLYNELVRLYREDMK